MSDSIRLRPHHLLCMLTYMGRGYTPGFVNHFDQLTDRLQHGARIKIVRGVDELCGTLDPKMPGYHCKAGEVGLRDTFAVQDLEKVLGRPLRMNMTLTMNPERVQQLRVAFKSGTIRRACKKCTWEKICDKVARDGFKTPDLRLYKRVIPIHAI